MNLEKERKRDAFSCGHERERERLEHRYNVDYT